MHKIGCQSANNKLFIKQVLFENDHDNLCSFKYNATYRQQAASVLNNTRQYCFGFNAGILKSSCDGKSECSIDLRAIAKVLKKFKRNYDGANCDFTADRMIVRYECINGSFVAFCPLKPLIFYNCQQLFAR